jgi:phosphate-selective porin
MTGRSFAAVSSLAAFVLLAVVVSTRGDAAAQAPEPAAPPAESRWRPEAGIFWRQGLNFNVRQPLGTWELSLSGRIGGKLAVDGAAFWTSGALDEVENGIELRRARLYVLGDFHLVLPGFYKFEIGLEGNDVVLVENYIGLKEELPVVGSVAAGNLQTPFGLDAVVSSRDLTFMELAAPMEAFAPGIKPGVVATNTAIDERLVWSLGLFASAGDKRLGNTSGLGQVMGRVTGLLVDTTPAGGRILIHLGASTSFLVSGDETIRYRSRPESHQAPIVVDTGDIRASGAVLAGLEAALVPSAP